MTRPWLEAFVARALADARVAWPAFHVRDEDFDAYLVARLPEDDAAPTALHTNDLYLACACAGGDALAVKAFRDTIVLDLDHAIVPAAGQNLDEVRQRVLERLLVADDGAAPRIVLYRGRGALHAWVRVAATRIAIDLTRRDTPEATLADAALEVAAADPELLHLKATYRGELRQSVARAASQLTSRERNLLRYSLLDGLTIDDLAALHGVHRATAARWLADARATLATQTKRDLRDRLGLAGPALESLFRLVESQFEVSWSVLRD